MSWSSMLKESDGTPSAIRVVMFTIIIVFLANWTIFNFKAGVMQPFPVDALIAILGSMVIKAGQKPFENKQEAVKTQA